MFVSWIYNNHQNYLTMSQLLCFNCKEILLQKTSFHVCRVCRDVLLCSDCINLVPLHDSQFPDPNPPNECVHPEIIFDEFPVENLLMCRSVMF